MFDRNYRLNRKGARMGRANKILLILVLAIYLVPVGAQLSAALEVGEKAPDFELESSKGGKLRLSSLKGKNVLINFYVLDFSPT
jgi:hypothetical protein